MHHLANFIPLLFPSIWVAMGVAFGAVSGWYRLMTRFPDKQVDPILRLYAQSGRLGAVSMGGVLTLAVCRQGLRVSTFRVFGLFNRPFLVPWTDIVIVRGNIMVWSTVTLHFGDPPVGTLLLFAPVANRLARAAGDLWPERGPLLQASIGSDARRRLWILSISVAGGFIASVLIAIDAHKPLLLAALVFSAVAGGLGLLVTFFMKRG